MTKRHRSKDPQHLARVRALPCLACAIDGEEQGSITEAHHIRRRAGGTLYGLSQKAHDSETIPLCQRKHHWNGVHCASKLSHREFETRYGNERDLLDMTDNQLSGGSR